MENRIRFNLPTWQPHMKIFYIVNARIPTEKAHGVQIMKMCEAFANLGVDIRLVLPWRSGVKKIDPFAHYNIRKNFSIVYLPIIETYALGYVGFIIGSLSFTIVSLLYGLAMRIRRNTNSGQVIFYSRDQDQFSFTSFFCGLRPYFFEVHGYKRKSVLHHILFKKAAGVIATNSFIKEKLLENFPFLKNRTTLEPNGVDVKIFNTLDKNEARKKLLLDVNKKIVVYAGHFYEWKGVEALVEVAERMLEDVQVCLVGGNDEDMERLKKKLPSAMKRVHFPGHRPYAEIPLWFAAADALVITGTSKDANSVHYTSPIKLFEYLAANRPIVAVDSPAVRDIVSSQEVYFYEPDSTESLRETLTEVLNNPTEAAVKATRAHAKSQQYDWGKRAERILSTVKSITAGKNIK